MPPIDRRQARLARAYPGGLLEKAAAGRIRTLDPETAASYLTALGTHGQPGHGGYYTNADIRRAELELIEGMHFLFINIMLIPEAFPEERLNVLETIPYSPCD